MEFRRENISALFEEAVPLMVKHYKEIAHYKDIELEPDWDAYNKAEEIDAVRVYTIRDDGQMIGYAIFFFHTNYHYRKSLQAYQDLIFIDPKHRGPGYKFIKWIDGQLKAEGIQIVYHHVKATKDFGPMLERIGYELVDKIYARRLDK